MEEAGHYYVQDFAFHIPGAMGRPMLEEGIAKSPTFVPIDAVSPAQSGSRRLLKTQSIKESHATHR